MDLIKATKCRKGTVYYLTGAWWENGSLINIPVKLKKVYTEKWTETMYGNFTRRRQMKWWIFQSINDPNLQVSAGSFDRLFTKPYNVKKK